LTAKYADACNFQFGSPLKEFPDWMRAKYNERKEFLPSQLKRLRHYCEEAGRSYKEIERTILGTIKIAPDTMAVTDVIELCRELAEISFEHVIFNMPNVHEIEPIEFIGREVVSQVADLA
jgi:hypothetical protein